jgi:mono/diheme cytochrome c family protein
MLELSRGAKIATLAILGPSLAFLPRTSDIVANAAGQPSVVAPTPTPARIRNPLANNPVAIRAGKDLFNRDCAECHGLNGVGDKGAPAFDTGGFMHGGADADVFHTIRTGVDGTEMEPHKAFTDQETWQLVAYIKSLSGGSRDRTFTEAYCLGCHNNRSKTGGLSLQGLSLGNVPAHSEIWEKALRKVASGEMPPAKAHERPNQRQAAAFASFLETTLDRAAVLRPDPGRAPAHRLNRAEYSNAIRDLLAVDVKPGEWLPVDDSGYGFDNIAAVLSTSPALLERYMSAARKISRLAIGDLALKPYEEIYSAKVEPGQSQRNEQLNGDLPFGSRGGMSFEHYFPLDAEYTFVLRRTGTEEIINSDFTVRKFVSAGLHTIGATTLRENLKPEIEGPVRGPAAKPDKPARRVLDLYIDRGRVERFEDEGTPTNVRQIVVRGPYNAKGRGKTPSRDKIFICNPATEAEETRCARRILTNLTRRAFRRPVTSADIDPLFAFYKTGRAGGDFEKGIETALRAMLVSPEYLFRMERDPALAKPGQIYRLSDVDLASRLSFFLWSSIPDEELLGLAEKGRLKEPLVLRAQLKRMLSDSRSRALVENFAGQWLQIRSVEQARPDANVFSFDPALRQSFIQETTLLVDSLVRENRSILDLLNADYTYLNQHLAEHYGVRNVYGSQFRRVAITDPNRRGLLGQGTMHLVTSYPNRTSVVQRGKWVLENLLGTPPPPAPADIPDLKAAPNGKVLTMREQMQVHRANPVCASCHSRMDPIGFALENYDGVGRWRDEDEGGKIDTSGKLPDGTEFQGPEGLRKLLLTKYKADFVHTAIEKLLTYSLGRGLESHDYPTVRAIARDAATDNYRIASLIAGVVNSTPFQMRRVPKP